MRKIRKQWLGFSLVELMAVVVVVGILVALALPRFRLFVARSRQAEAINHLGTVHRLQLSYNLWRRGFGEANAWHSGMNMGMGASPGTCNDNTTGTKNTLGFRVEDCNALRYAYRSLGAGIADRADNTARGNKYIYPDCGNATNQADRWNIGKAGGSLNHPNDVIEGCSN